MHTINIDRMLVSPVAALGALVLFALGIILRAWAVHVREDQDR